MRMVKGNLWDYQANWRAIPTNGMIKSNGELVMGAGVALQAKVRYPKLAKVIGEFVSQCGNIVGWIQEYRIVSFPTKNNWAEKSSLELIDQSARQMMDKLPDMDIVAMPRVGCGYGQLDWNDVLPVLMRYCDDRIVIVNEK
jgi:O-acetyl-ADP-ribose deacetylase (regulator of RNase III)